MTLVVNAKIDFRGSGHFPFTLYQISVDVDEPASLTVSEGAALSMVEVEVWLSARGLDEGIEICFKDMENPNNISDKLNQISNIPIAKF